MRDLSLHLMDIVQNSVKAKANAIRISFEAQPAQDWLIMAVEDNGSGMPLEMVEAVKDPFVTSRTTRSVGLGIPLLKELCELTGGELLLESTLGLGTNLSARLGLHSIDRLPLGDIGGTLFVLVSADPQLDYSLIFSAPDRLFELNLHDLREELDGVPLDEPEVLAWIRDYVREQQQAIFAGFLDEIEVQPENAPDKEIS
jgi:hypothetical protein